MKYINNSAKEVCVSRDTSYFGYLAKALTVTSVAMLLMFSPPALAASGGNSLNYKKTILVPPSADPILNFAQSFGVNDNGKVILGADAADGSRSAYVYDLHTGEYEVIGSGDYTEFGALGINNKGEMSGGAVEQDCLWRDKDGNVLPISVPQSEFFCSSRGINDVGIVTGAAVGLNSEGNVEWTGWTYNTKTGELNTFLPSAQTFAQGITNSGEIVGSVRYRNDQGARETFGYLRDKNGEVKQYSLTNSIPGQTRARGISSNGKHIVGFYYDNTFTAQGYIMDADALKDSDSITLRDDQILNQYIGESCAPIQTELPAFGFVVNYLGSEMFAQDVNGQGVIAAQCSDVYEFYDNNGNFLFVDALIFAMILEPVNN